VTSLSPPRFTSMFQLTWSVADNKMSTVGSHTAAV
jgi:hypothetical protein